ncbi:hypothetical protein HYU40_01735 [Candidatus Woesearchaeota archaeon]|nr:hypothetical protein [Candidatus Woesearchaeota archaeon]
MASKEALPRNPLSCKKDEKLPEHLYELPAMDRKLSEFCLWATKTLINTPEASVCFDAPHQKLQSFSW